MDSAVYEERQRPTWYQVTSVLFTATMSVLFSLQPVDPDPDRLRHLLWQKARPFAVVVCGLASIVLAVTLVRRWGRVAFRVDGTGVTLGSLPGEARRHPLTIPWDQISSITLFRMPTSGSEEVHVELHEASQSADTGLPVRGWKLDVSRLATAMAAYAPPDIKLNDYSHPTR